MKHAFIDSYANLESCIHRLSTEKKIIAALIFLLLIVLCPALPWLIIAWAAMLILLIYLSRVPWGFILKKIIPSLPFIFFISLLNLFRENGYVLFIGYAVKAILAVALVILLTSTTRFDALLEGLRNLALPHPVILLLSFMYRYLFLLEDRFLRTRRAYDSRCGKKINSFFQLRTLSNIVGVLFIRTYELAERVYLAMCARGFNGEKGN